MKYLLLSLSLWLCSYSASALEQDEFNFLIDNIKQKNFDEVSILESLRIAQNISEHSVMADQLISMLKTSKEIDNKWQWGKVGSMEADPEEFMIQGLLPRTAMLFRLESEEGDL